jgi:hypothetical protein
MARKIKKKFNPADPIVGEVVDLRTDFEKELEKQALEPQEPAPLALTKDELHRLQLSQFQARAFEAEQRLEMIKRDQFLKQVDPEGKLQQMMALIRGRTDEAAVAKAEYAKVVKDIEERLKILLKEYAYDDQNGQLTKLD